MSVSSNIDWRQVTKSQGESVKFIHTVSLSTRSAKTPVVLRLLGVTATDVISVQLVHLGHTPYAFSSKVDTFLDLWIDPFEFDCSKYSLDELPVDLEVQIEWHAFRESSLFVPLDTHKEWFISGDCESVQEATVDTLDDPDGPDLSKSFDDQVYFDPPLLTDINNLSTLKETTPQDMAHVLLVLSTFLSVGFNPALVMKKTNLEPTYTQVYEYTNVTAESAYKTIPNASFYTLRTEKSLAQLLIPNAIKYWPSFRESKLTSWVSTVINATIRDENDRNDSDIPEDFDIIELLSSSYPQQPWSKPNPVNSTIVPFLQGLAESYVLNECKGESWRDSLTVLGLAMAQPHMSICLPNEKPPSYPFTWSFGTILRNYLYGWIFLHLGTDPTMWFQRINISSDQIKQLCNLLTNITFLFTEQNFELFLKRIIMVFMKAVQQ